MELLPEINPYIEAAQPLGIQNPTISELGAGEYNVNYLIEDPDRKLVLRVSVSQLSGAKDQLKHEYDVLTYLRGQDIAPDAYYLDMDGFRYPVLLEEFIEGSPVTKLDEGTLTKIGHAIATINNVPIVEPHPFEVRSIDYGRDINDQERVLASVSETDDNRELLEAARHYATQALKQLGDIKPDVQTMLIRRDANPNNFIITPNGIRMVDWEITRVDDPTITLASFINEVVLYDVLNLHPSEADMETVKRAFAAVCTVPNFEELLGNRLLIEQLGGLTWGLERIDNLRRNPSPEDFANKRDWYNKVVRNSLQALSKAFPSS